MELIELQKNRSQSKFQRTGFTQNLYRYQSQTVQEGATTIGLLALRVTFDFTEGANRLLGLISIVYKNGSWIKEAIFSMNSLVQNTCVPAK